MSKEIEALRVWGEAVDRDRLVKWADLRLIKMFVADALEALEKQVAQKHESASPAPAEDLVERCAKAACDGHKDGASKWDVTSYQETYRMEVRAVLALLRSEGRLCEPGKARAEGWDANVAASKVILARAEKAEAEAETFREQLSSVALELAKERKNHKETKRRLARAWHEAGIPNSGPATGCAPCRCGGFRQPGDPWCGRNDCKGGTVWEWLKELCDDEIRDYTLAGMTDARQLTAYITWDLQDNAIATASVYTIATELLVSLFEFEKFFKIERSEHFKFAVWVAAEIFERTKKEGRALTMEEKQAIVLQGQNKPIVCFKCGWKDVAYYAKGDNEHIYCLKCAKEMGL